MKIAVIGTGYVGLVTGTCFAELGNEVHCVDINPQKINKLNQGIVPIYEPALTDLIKRNAKESRLFFTTELKSAIQKSAIVFICVGTPPQENGESDLSQVWAAADGIADALKDYKVIVSKSTVPVGTAHKILERIRKKNTAPFDVVSNPEFLREGEAVLDFMTPDRIIVGVEGDRAKKIMEELYQGVVRINKPLIFTDIKTAELIKYASNAMLATRISFMNELARLCDATGADIKMIAQGMGLDNRIGPRFLQAGTGYGGSCFGKDIKSLIATMRMHGIDGKILSAVDRVNEEQKMIVVRKIESALGNINKKTIGVLGLAFKPKTDDMRDAPAVAICTVLHKMGAHIKAFDPESMENAKAIMPFITYCHDAYETAQDADALVIITEWNEFRSIEREKLKGIMKSPIIIDGRNIYEPHELKKEGFTYQGIGRR